MQKQSFDPLLLEAIHGKHSAGKVKPAIADLKSKLAMDTAAHADSISGKFIEQEVFLRCKACNKRGRYNIGHITVNAEKYIEEKGQIEDYLQFTGYFRCKQCNQAGDWAFMHEFLIGILGNLMGSLSSGGNEFISFTVTELYDGYQPRFGTDSENHLLRKILASPDDGYLWNKLGNVYYGGGRPELAVAAYEQSIRLDPLQTESYYSLGMIIVQFDVKKAIPFYHRLFVTAPYYKQLPFKKLRGLVAIGIRDIIYWDNNEQNFPLLPDRSVYEEMGISFENERPNKKQVFEGTIDLDRIQSFYPLATLFIKKPEGKRIT